MERKGLIQIYTGDGKGKTTAAVGLAVRAAGQGLRVCYVYFHKDPDKWGYTEHGILKKIGVDVFGFAGKHSLCDEKADIKEIRGGCLKGLDFIKELYRQNKYDLLILDEINISLRDGFLKIEEVIPLLTAKPAGLELVLTGRSALPELIKLADLVSNIQKIKHPYDKGVKLRKGIEY
jgi:cob(I)alamin adenosyltransferase